MSSTIARWDGEETAERLELLLGPDLQFIRINGTVVGGLAGLCLHARSSASSDQRRGDGWLRRAEPHLRRQERSDARSKRSSVAETLQGLGAALPVLVDLDEQLEVGARRAAARARRCRPP